MKDFDELDDILASIKSKDNLTNDVPLAPPVKSRAQRAAEEKAEQERLAKEKAEKERLAQECSVKEKAEKARLESERLAREKAEKERLAREEKERDAALKQMNEDTEQINVQTEEIPELEPPKSAVKREEKAGELVWFTPDESDKYNKNPKKLKIKKSKSDKKISISKPDFNKFKTEFRNNFVPKFKTAFKKIFTKQLAIAAGIIVLIIAVAFGGIRLYEYSRVAYLKPYEEQYGIKYPVGILEEFCDQYGQNQHTVGELVIEDTNTKKYVANQITKNYVYAFEGTDVNEKQQFMAVDVTGYADLESIYSTPEGFLNSSQKVTFNTLFEKADYKVIAAYYTNKNPEDDSEYVFPYSIYGNITSRSFDHYADSINHRRLYDTGFELTSDNDYLSVCADSDFMENFKFVVLCVKSDSEKFEKSSTAKPNESIHYPQVWYDAKGETNVYRFSGKWYPEIYTDIESGKTVKLTADDFER
ncbi:MAG: hypothetical protein ACLUFN_00010 [Eubacterium sp.]